MCVFFFLFFFERSRSKQKTTIEEGGGGWKILCLLDHLGRGIWNSQKPATKRTAQRAIKWNFVQIFFKIEHICPIRSGGNSFFQLHIELLTLRSSPFNNISTHEVVLTDSNYLPYKCLYIFYPLLQDHFFVFKVYPENSVLKYVWLVCKSGF